MGLDDNITIQNTNASILLIGLWAHIKMYRFTPARISGPSISLGHCAAFGCPVSGLEKLKLNVQNGARFMEKQYSTTTLVAV